MAPRSPCSATCTGPTDRMGEEPAMATGFQVTFDAHDPARLAEFWANALG